MAITKIQAGALPADVITTAAIDDASITHAKLHTTMDLSSKTVTLPTLSTLNTTGNVGVGTDDPGNRKIKIHGTSGDVSGEISTDDTSNAFLRFSTDLDGTHRSGIIGIDYSDNVFKLNHGGSFDGVLNGLAIDSSGNVGINSTNPSAKLTVEGTFSVRTSSNQSFNDSNNANNLTMTDSKAHFNIDGADKDFQVSSDTVTHSLFVQGSDGNVGIRTNSPDAPLDVTRVGDGTIAIFQNTGNHGFEFSAPSSTALQIASRQGSKNLDLWANTLSFSAGGSESMRIDSSGNIGIGTTSPDAIFTVDTNVAAVSTGTIARFHSSKGESDSTFLQIAATRHPTASVQRVQLQAFDDDGSTGRTLALNSSGGNVGIGTNSPNATLTVSQSANNIFAVERTGVASGSGQFGINVENNSQATVSYDDGAQLVFGTASSPSIHTGFTERMRIDSSGIVTKPYQPIGSFSHSASVNYSQDDLTSANFYSHTWVNQGNHFNASTGRFTCPVAGIYRIYFRATGSGNSNIRLRKNGSTVNEAYENAGTNHSVSSEAVVPCAANDYLHIQIASGNFLSGTQHKQVTFELMS